VGNPVQNMIFATDDGGDICKKIANLLKNYGNIPFDVQYGSAADQDSEIMAKVLSKINERSERNTGISA
jgi:hypothetical protein